MPYPITKHARGLLRIQSGTDQVKSDLLALILTNQGERVMLPNFGVSLRRFLFEPNDEVLRQQVRNAIESQLRRWEPRVVIDGIEVISVPDKKELDSTDTLENQEAILLIRILFFDHEQIQEVQELRLEIPVGD